MKGLFIQWIPTLAIILILSMQIIFFILNKNFKNRNRRKPFGSKSLPSPGESLRLKIEEINVNLPLYLMLPTLTLLFFFSSYSFYKLYRGEIGWKPAEIFIICFATISCLIYSIVKIIKLYNKRNCLQLGLEAERDVGEKLDRLRSYGCFVYHDFPAEGFNIDHILITKSGIFAIETKGRTKKTNLKKNWKVQFHDNKLIFPDKEETAPIKQAKRQAKWLSRFISQKIGRKISVTAVLALPGWFLEIKQKPQNLLLTNGHNLDFLVKYNQEVINKNIMILIKDIIEQHCKNASILH